jgi:4-amino-4-deoxy-L-arabinose transferase-like glycosyltransferase
MMFPRLKSPGLVSAVLLLFMAVNLVTVIARKSITIDETLGIPAGYYYLKTRSFNIDSDHPPLPKILSACPLLLLDLETPSFDDLRDQPEGPLTLFLADRFWTANKGHFKQIFFWSRVPMVLMTVGLGALIFTFTRRLFGSRAAIFAVALFSLEPTILAHGRVAKDIHVAFVYALFFFALYLYGLSSTWRRAVFLGIACGVALADKYSMLILFPILVAGGVVVWLRSAAHRLRVLAQIVTASFVALVVVNVVYLFQRQPLSGADLAALAKSNEAHAGTMLKLLGPLSTILPQYFLSGVFITFNHNDLGHPGFLLGQYSDHGWWYYFPVAFALKTTIPFLVLTIVSLGWSFCCVYRRDWKLLVPLVPILIYGVSAMFADINIGIRHLLPLFPFLFMLAGAFLDRLFRIQRSRGLVQFAVAVIFVLSIVEVIRVYPNYIPYMNQLASGRPHWTLLSDSNIEWGDDTGALGEYLKAKGETKVRAACLGGAVVLPLYDVQYLDLLSPPEVKLEETRYVAIGASFLNGSTVPGWSAGSGRETPEQMHNYFARYREREPEAVFGGTIYLFRER